jgi:uncharacterized membrane protein YkvA (DUF1232 family)
MRPIDLLFYVARAPKHSKPAASKVPSSTYMATSWVKLQREANVFYFAFKHPRVPWYARLIAACTVAYLFSPIQLIPSFIPVVGFVDDLIVLFVGVKLLRKIIPPDVLTECRQLAEAADREKKEVVRSTASAIGFAAVVSLWLAVAVISSALMLKYIRR